LVLFSSFGKLLEELKKNMKFFGKKSEALFDYWSFGHAGFFYVVAKFFLQGYTLERALLVYVILAFVWEFIERALESWDYNGKKIFFKEKECWMNRYVGDLISGLIGFALGYFY